MKLTQEDYNTLMSNLAFGIIDSQDRGFNNLAEDLREIRRKLAVMEVDLIERTEHADKRSNRVSRTGIEG